MRCLVLARIRSVSVHVTDKTSDLVANHTDSILRKMGWSWICLQLPDQDNSDGGYLKMGRWLEFLVRSERACGQPAPILQSAGVVCRLTDGSDIIRSEEHGNRKPTAVT
jgi:hypothetical protein